MAVNETTVQASPERVFAVLSDAASYADWVVGASRVRDADATWPAVGTRFHHVQGVGRVGIHDHTEVLASRPAAHLRLLVRARPVVTAVVDLRLEAAGSGTTVRMQETIVGGIQRLAPDRVNDLFLRTRNAESLRRLRSLAERDREDVG